MKKTYKLRVNDDYEFELTPDDLSALDLMATDPTSFHVLDNDKSYHVSLEGKDFNRKGYQLEVNHSKYRVLIADPLDILIDKMGFELGATAKVSSIEAPMPGLILEVSVNEGQDVKEGDDLLILEAMKMENVLTSPRDGVIKQITVTQGEAVEKKHVLITFE